MKSGMMKIPVCVGIMMIALGITGCNEPEIKVDIKNLVNPDDDGNIESLEGNWKFSIGDDQEWKSPDYDDSDWEEIRVPSAWENEGFHGYNGFAWYRKKFFVPDEVKSTGFYLELGHIDDVDETYVNGQLIGVSGGFPPEFVTAYTAYRKYFIPKEILKNGSNLIAVRVYDSLREGGIVHGPCGISPVKPDDFLISDLDLDINLSGQWKIRTGDDMEWKEPGFDDSGWKNIFVPSHWEPQGLKQYDGFAWYRLTFYLSEKYENRKMVLVLGKIDDIDQTYVNGELAGSTGNWNFESVPTDFMQNDEWEAYRGYYIPENILEPGKKNTIAVRVYDGYIDGGIYKGPIGLITQEKYRTLWKRNK